MYYYAIRSCATLVDVNSLVPYHTLTDKLIKMMWSTVYTATKAYSLSIPHCIRDVLSYKEKRKSRFEGTYSGASHQVCPSCYALYELSLSMTGVNSKILSAFTPPLSNVLFCVHLSSTPHLVIRLESHIP